MMSARELASAVFLAVDSQDLDSFGAQFTPDARFTFGNAEPNVGVPTIAAGVGGFFAGIRKLSHAVQDVWEQDRTVIVRVAVTYTRLDGQVLTLPCANIWQRAADGRIADYRIYMDVNPVFA